MVITIQCPSCATSFPVDPKKVPAGGVRVRCSSCGEIFRVEKPAEPVAPVAAPVAAAQEAVLHAPTPAPSSETAPPAPPPAEVPPAEPEIPRAEVPLAEREIPLPPPLPEPSAEPPAAAVPPAPTPPVAPAAPQAPPQPEGSKTLQGFTFGKRDPADKAKRLARVLVSDMIMYNAERHQNAIAQGTLRQDFEEEIEKSWKEFVEQVGAELAEGPGRAFWREALNDILAKGQDVF